MLVTIKSRIPQELKQEADEIDLLLLGAAESGKYCPDAINDIEARDSKKNKDFRYCRGSKSSKFIIILTFSLIVMMIQGKSTILKQMRIIHKVDII